MQISGEMIIGHRAVKGQGGDVFAIAAVSGEALEPAFGAASAHDIDQACELAESAFDTYRQLPDERRASFLDAIAQGLLDLGDNLTERAHLESGLPKPRLEGERMRTVTQLRLFATLLRDGRWHGAVLDSALPERAPLPRADLRQRRISVGPVAVFGSSNFPLAFSVAGGDTASALAAGSPVVVKAHNAHLGTSELVARVIQQAAKDTGMPEGVFSLVLGTGNDIGQALVSHPAIQAVGFTGSRQGGLALLRAAQARAVPIPVYAEMSSVNPVFLMPSALQARGPAIAKSFVDSLVLGAGQFCTNPGLLIAIEGEALEVFVKTAANELAARAPTTMLTPGIHGAYCQGLKRLRDSADVQPVAEGLAPKGLFEAQPAVFRTDAKAFLANPTLEDENFGPSSLLIVCRDFAEMRKVASRLAGQLTATLQLDQADHAQAAELLPTLERKAGRILFNDFPTGVEVSYAMVHGGPFPATADNRTTSVGAAAIERFLRPVCYQNVPDNLLPPSLTDANPLNLWRLRDGELVKG
ncbi:aldehyde dehydrogenase (NADP(+)) [Pseudomonas sp. NA-150]|uniref:aldehyde dehydrogenase (NADP(+)) n=1 Tax=Pseudomonas sp. NA-150 TaxID=3367525 RepID=UPI0037C766D7